MTVTSPLIQLENTLAKLEDLVKLLDAVNNPLFLYLRETDFPYGQHPPDNLR